MHFFTRQLLQWHPSLHRPLPWKGSRNAYHIWLSEIILQQTRAEQGLPYYQKFVQTYPQINDLADAPEADIFKLWEGLGYYSRARNLHATAKYIKEKYKGIFPNKYDEILALKGVGTYTAAAIASFAYDLPYSVLDGNVYRVLSRFFGITTPIDSSEGKKQFAKLAQELLDVQQPALYNQAIMDFGAVHCRPASPLCAQCPMASQCVAFAEQKVTDYPIKSKKIKKKIRYFNYFIFNYNHEILIRKRVAKDIWQDLYDFPCIETTEICEGNAVFELAEWQDWMAGRKYQVRSISAPLRQTLTHQYIAATFIEIHLEATFFLTEDNLYAIERKKIANFAFPKVVNQYLQTGATPSLF